CRRTRETRSRRPAHAARLALWLATSLVLWAIRRFRNPSRLQLIGLFADVSTKGPAVDSVQTEELTLHAAIKIQKILLDGLMSIPTRTVTLEREIKAAREVEKRLRGALAAVELLQMKPRPYGLDRIPAPPMPRHVERWVQQYERYDLARRL